MNPLAPVISTQIRSNVEATLSNLATNYISPRTVAAIHEINDYVQTYGIKNSLFFSLMKTHISLGFPDFLNPDAKKFKTDTAKLLTAVYLMLLEIRGVRFSELEISELQQLSSQLVKSAFSIQAKLETLNASNNYLGINIITALLKDQTESTNPIGNGLIRKLILSLYRGQLLTLNDANYDLDLFEKSIYLLLLKFENIFEVSDLLAEIIPDAELDHGVVGESIRATKDLYWPQILQIAYDQMQTLTERGARELLSKNDITLLQQVWNSYVNDPDGENPVIKLQTWINEVFYSYTSVILEIHTFDFNSTKILTDILVRINSINVQNDNGLKEFLLESYYKHINQLLSNCVDLEQNVAQIMQNSLKHLGFKTYGLADTFREKSLCMLFDKFHRSHPHYKQSLLDELLQTNREFFKDLHDEARWEDRPTPTLEFFKILSKNGTLKRNKLESEQLPFHQAYPLNKLDYPAANASSITKSKVTELKRY